MCFDSLLEGDKLGDKLGNFSVFSRGEVRELILSLFNIAGTHGQLSEHGYYLVDALLIAAEIKAYFRIGKQVNNLICDRYVRILRCCGYSKDKRCCKFKKRVVHLRCLRLKIFCAVPHAGQRNQKKKIICNDVASVYPRSGK